MMQLSRFTVKGFNGSTVGKSIWNEHFDGFEAWQLKRELTCSVKSTAEP